MQVCADTVQMSRCLFIRAVTRQNDERGQDRAHKNRTRVLH